MIKELVTKISHATFGIYYVAKSQKSFRILLAYGLITILLGLILPITGVHWMMISFAIVTVFIAEMTNTVAEFLCDLIHKKKSVYVKLIKDVSAGIVLLAVLWALVIGLVIFIPAIIALL